MKKRRKQPAGRNGGRERERDAISLTHTLSLSLSLSLLWIHALFSWAASEINRFWLPTAADGKGVENG